MSKPIKKKPVVRRVVGTIFLGRVEILMLLMPIYRHPRRVGIGKPCNHRAI